MKYSVKLFIFTVLIAALSFAQTKRSTPQDAEKWVKKAITFYKANGKEKALEEFSNPKGKFVKDDLYMLVYDLTGKCLAHGTNPKFIGKDLIGMKDADGKAYIAERVEIAKTKGSGWQNYKWINPLTKAIEEKTLYLEKVDNMIFGCGSYKK